MSVVTETASIYYTVCGFTQTSKESLRCYSHCSSRGICKLLTSLFKSHDNQLISSCFSLLGMFKESRCLVSTPEHEMLKHAFFSFLYRLLHIALFLQPTTRSNKPPHISFKLKSLQWVLKFVTLVCEKNDIKKSYFLSDWWCCAVCTQSFCCLMNPEETLKEQMEQREISRQVFICHVQSHDSLLI